ncbi:type VI secretion system-associated protein TagF [Paludibacterium denitrificans]|uniref:Type VI secretion system-associated protein TagF n=1 Tax=Paludibacterium denitrificans TaxID=2675226 RepID=A0A844GD31_9NEIS|nr:type VI secretion system-associated protein TagF [Paludibacterium denitrificans]MTD33569.1 type VI secretion system-associated protein TagF [Paludibacterium denitrificans]
MAFNFKRTQDLGGQFCIFGKLPRRADFIRINATHPAASQLDHVIADSLVLLGDDAARQRYLRMPATSLLTRSPDGAWLSLGVIQPSRDESGRLYPLVAASLLPSDIPHPSIGVMMLSNELFFNGLQEQLRNAIDNAVEMVACRQYLEAQALFGAGSLDDIKLAEQLLGRHLSMTPCSHLSTLLAGSGDTDLAALLLSFVFHSQLQRKFRGSLSSQAYLLPLPAGDGEDMLAVVTWLTLFSAATTGLTNMSVQCLVIRQPEQNCLALVPGMLTAPMLAQCWGITLDPRFVIDVSDKQAPWRSHQSYAEALYILSRRLGDSQFSLAQLCDVMASLSLSIV